MKSLFSFASFVLLLSFTSCKSDSTATAGTAEAKAEGAVSDKEATIGLSNTHKVKGNEFVVVEFFNDFCGPMYRSN